MNLDLLAIILSHRDISHSSWYSLVILATPGNDLDPPPISVDIRGWTETLIRQGPSLEAEVSRVVIIPGVGTAVHALPRDREGGLNQGVDSITHHLGQAARGLD